MCIWLTATRHLNWQFFRQPLLDKPPSFTAPDPLKDPIWYGELWHRYPSSHTLSQTHFAEYVRAKFDLMLICHQIGRNAFGENTTLSTHQAVLYARQLTEWFRRLPSILTPEYIVLPAHLLLQ